MNKFKILYFCFAIIFVTLSVYLELYIKLVSLYWLIAELAGFLFIIVGRIVLDVLEGIELGRNIFFKTLWMMMVFGYLGYLVINNYKRSTLQDRFGPAFNAKRGPLNIPAIPSGWQLKFRNKGNMKWQTKDSVIGHQSKYIGFDKDYGLYEEFDEYDFKPHKGFIRKMYINTHFSPELKVDSISFIFDEGDYDHHLSRQQADSIFAAEKIKKDY